MDVRLELLKLLITAAANHVTNLVLHAVDHRQMTVSHALVIIY